jgi:hypothetical protein
LLADASHTSARNTPHKAKAMKSLATKTIFLLALAIAARGNAIGGILLFDIDADPATWATSVGTFRTVGTWNLNSLPDFGVSSIGGPLTSSGGGPIPAGFIPSSVSIDASRFFPSEPISLAFVGPSANGMTNSENAIVPNQPQDSLIISFFSAVSAFEFYAISCDLCSGGLGLIDVVVSDDHGDMTTFASIAAPGAGAHYGLLATYGASIRSVNLNGPGPEVGSPGQNQYFPGIQGEATVFAIPEPATSALLGIGLVGIAASRRR